MIILCSSRNQAINLALVFFGKLLLGKSSLIKKIVYRAGDYFFVLEILCISSNFSYKRGSHPYSYHDLSYRR